MEKQKKHKEWSEKPSLWKRFKNWILATALWVTLVAWVSACDSGKWGETDKKSDKKETVIKTQTQVQTDIATFPEEKAGWPSIEPDLDTQGRKVVSTEEYDDGNGLPITKETYEDGSWSESYTMKGHGSYCEHYPNNNIKFDYGWNGDEFGYTIYDEQGKILYWEEAIITCHDGEDEYDKYDKKGRLIEDVDSKYIYNDKNNTKTRIRTPLVNKKCKIVTVYAITDDGETIISNVFVWETWKEIDLMNWWIDKLIKDRGLEEVPYIDYYQDLRWE